MHKVSVKSLTHLVQTFEWFCGELCGKDDKSDTPVTSEILTLCQIIQTSLGFIPSHPRLFSPFTCAFFSGK